jgi:hypothetical protein
LQDLPVELSSVTIIHPKPELINAMLQATDPVAANPLGTARVLKDGQSTNNIYFFDTTNNIYSRNRNKKHRVHSVGGTEKENK